MLTGRNVKIATATINALKSGNVIQQWKDYVLFYEYIHGDNGAGLGASHQTGWTGLIAKLIELFGHVDPQQFWTPLTHA